MRLQSAHQANDLKVMEAQNVILFFSLAIYIASTNIEDGREKMVIEDMIVESI